MSDVKTPAGPPATEATSTRSERIEFLKHAVAFNEGNIRAYDIKAQISLAAFVLSGNPLIGVIGGACSTGTRNVLVITLVVYVVTILSFLWVLWPVEPSQQRLTEGLDARDLFYLPNPLAIGGADYSARLQGLVLEPELTAESLKLSYIRTVKARRFRNALIITLAAYLTVLAAFFFVGRCAF